MHGVGDMEIGEFKLTMKIITNATKFNDGNSSVC